jgi:hypothetical protein
LNLAGKIGKKDSFKNIGKKPIILATKSYLQGKYVELEVNNQSSSELTFFKNLEESFAVFKLKPTYFLGLILITTIFSMIPYMSMAVNFLYPGIYFCFIRLMNNEEISFKDLFWSFQSLDNFLNTLVMIVLMVIMIVVGFILLIIPGIYLSIMFLPAYFLLITDKKNAIDTIKNCHELIKNEWWNTFWFACGLAVLNIIGILCLIVGIIFTASLSIIMMIKYINYLKLKKLNANHLNG